MALLGLPHFSSSDFLKIHLLQLVDIEIGLKTGSLKAAIGEIDQDEESLLSLGKRSIEKKRFLSDIARMRGGGGSTHARIFRPSFSKCIFGQ